MAGHYWGHTKTQHQTPIAPLHKRANNLTAKEDEALSSDVPVHKVLEDTTDVPNVTPEQA